SITPAGVPVNSRPMSRSRLIAGSPLHHRLAADDDVLHVAPGKAVDDVGRRHLPPEGARRVERDEVGEHPRLQLPRLPAQRAHPVYGRGLEELQRLVEHTATERAPLVEIDASRLLQDVDHCVGIASGGKPASCPAQDLQWSDLVRSEEHTSELQSLAYLVCRLLLE